MSLEHLVEPENKEMFKKQNDGGMAKGHRHLKELPKMVNLSNKINNAVLDYNPKDKLNINRSIQI